MSVDHWLGWWLSKTPSNRPAENSSLESLLCENQGWPNGLHSPVGHLDTQSSLWVSGGSPNWLEARGMTLAVANTFPWLLPKKGVVPKSEYVVWFLMQTRETPMYLSSYLDQPLDLTSKPREERVLGSLEIKASSSSLPGHLAACFVYGSSSLNVCWRDHQTSQLGTGIRNQNIWKEASLGVCVFARGMCFCLAVCEATGHWNTGIIRLPLFHGFQSVSNSQSGWLVMKQTGRRGLRRRWPPGLQWILTKQGLL